MKLTLNLIIPFFVALALTQLYFFLKRRCKKTEEDLFEYPKIARVEVHPYPCKVCGNPLKHNDLVVWSEKNGWQSKTSHANCLVFIRHPDGSVTHPDGKSVRSTPNGVILDPVPRGSLYLTEEEWDNWAPPKLEVEISPDRRVLPSI
jgi:hypothetical protein